MRIPNEIIKRRWLTFSGWRRIFPASPLAEEARIWIGVLDAFEKAKQVDLDIEAKKKELSK